MFSSIKNGLKTLFGVNAKTTEADAISKPKENDPNMTTPVVIKPSKKSATKKKAAPKKKATAKKKAKS
tara:strand:+ start:2475 stop:2678 length:204 start_codon:yes stop_codon:yes gene_type:complete